MSKLPDWLRDILASASSPRAATSRLLFHGTLELFGGRLTASRWEHLRWTTEDPCVAQSYCPEKGALTGWWPPEAWRLDENLLPDGPINRIIFRDLGFHESDLDARRDHTGRFESWRVLPDHPKQRDALAYMQTLGYNAGQTMIWVKTRTRGNLDTILPADHKDSGRLFILERPAGLQLYDHASKVDGGLTGRQWTHTSTFREIAASGSWDGIIIDDVHQSELLGHFSHASIGLFEPTLQRLRYHVIPIVHFDPWECWKRNNQSTTPEFDALWTLCHEAMPMAA